MDANIIVWLYEENKLFQGKKMKFFKDPGEIKKHKYIKMMPQDETIIFGIKKLLLSHIMTDKAFYYEYTDTDAESYIDKYKLKRIPLQDIINLNIGEDFIELNGDKVEFPPLTQADHAFMQSIKNIFSGLPINTNERIETSQAIAADTMPDDLTHMDNITNDIDAAKIFQLYEQNKPFDFRIERFFKDADKIKQHKYHEILRNDEHILFGIEKNLCFHIVTDKAFYYTSASPKEVFNQKRLPWKGIYEWNIGENSLTVNGDKIDLGSLESRSGQMFIMSLKNIFSGLAIDLKKLAPTDPIVRKSVDYETVRQICRDYSIINGEKTKYLVEPDKFNRYIDKIYSNEPVAAVFKKKHASYIFTNKAFYSVGSLNKSWRLEYENIESCRPHYNEGNLFINDSIIEFGLPETNDDEKLMHSIEGILVAIISMTTCYESLAPLRFDETVSVSEHKFTIRFEGRITEVELLKAAQLCRKAFENEEFYNHKGFDPQFYDNSICYDPYTYKQHEETFIEPELKSPLLFKYEDQQTGFYISKKHFVVYRNGQQNAVRLLLSQIGSLSLNEQSGRVYLTVNELEDLTIEITRPYVNACSLLFISLCAVRSDDKLALTQNLIEQFTLLRLLKSTWRIVTPEKMFTPFERVVINAKFDYDLPQDKNFIFWASDSQMIYLDDSALIYGETDNGSAKPVIRESLNGVRVDFRHGGPPSDPNAGYFAGAAFGLAGMAFGASIDKARQTITMFFYSELQIGSKSKPLHGLNPSDAVLLRFLIATAAA